MPTNIHRNYTEKKTNYIFILPLLLILVSSSIYSCSKKKKIEPQILQVSPDVVWSGEDNQVEIFGKNFIEGAKLNIKEDKKEASIFSVYLLGEAGKIDVPFSKESEEKVKAVIKKGTTPGNYRIFVEIGNKQKASYPIKVLRLPIPYIEKISRDKVSNISEQIIILEGKNFQEITKVYIGDKEVEFSFSETQVVIKIPPDFPPGDYEIKVVNSEGSYALYSKISVVEGAKIEYKVQKPQNIFANSNTQFSVQITNKGKAKANIKISLNIDGNIKQIQTEISPEETKEVNFDVFVSANLEFELIIEGEDELGGVFSISSKETMIANCSPEICDGKDNDCNGLVDDGVLITFYKDNDGDGYGDPNNSIQACSQPAQYVQNSDDCNDNNNLINPNTIWFKDYDGDGFTDGITQISCQQPTGYVLNAIPGDCNDNNSNINPNTTWFKDADGDGFTDGTFQVSCVQPAGFVLYAPGGDCDDSDPARNPGQSEICDGKDNNCDGQIDEGVLLTFYRDQDGDGYGNANNPTQACLQPGGYVQNPFDCNDNNALIYPGAPLNCNNGQDNDCSGNIETWAYTDQDGDRYAPNSTSSCVDVVLFPGQITAGQELGYNDCNDNNASIYPGAPLNCSNGQDNDCSGNIETWAYTDQDGDRYAPNNVSSCVDVVNFPGKITAGQELGYNDCNDTNPAINPGASEVCNGIDDNCNEQADEGIASCEIPTCPTTISALYFFKSSTGDISISLSWNDPATNESGFVIEKSKFPIFSPSVSFVINTPNTTSYTLDFQEPLTQFYFRVYAFNPTGSCVPIATASTYTPPGLLWAFPLTGAPQDANNFAVNPKMFDINGDGKKEIIIADNQGYVYAISTVEYNLQISSIPLWISRPGVNAEISTPAIAVYQGNPTVVVSDQVNKKIHILGKDGNLIRTITLTQTPYPPIITDFNGDLLPDILVSIGDGGLVAYSFSGAQIFSVPAPHAEMFFFPSVFEYKGSSTYIVLGTNQKRIKGFSGNTEILNIDLSNLPFTNFNPFNFISTFKIGNLSHAAFSTQDGFLHIIRLVKNPLIKFNTNQNVVAKPLFYDFNNDGTPDIAINSGQTLFFIDGKTGNQICQFNLGSASYSSPALLTDTVSVVVGTDGGQIYAIKPDCYQRWSYLIAGFQIRSSPLVADIDKDGTIEIVVGAESAAAGKIIILKSDGNLETEITSLKPIRSSPKIGDINGDGIYEVVIGTDQIPLLTTGGVLILNCPTDCASSYNLTSYTDTGWGKVRTTPLLYDLNSDGFLDIVFAGENQKLYAMSGTSINYSQPYLLWSANFAGVGQMAPGVIFPSSPTLFIKSGVPYIAIGSNGKGLYIVNGSNGSLDQQLFSGKNCFSSPATFDYNKDGVGDIVIGCDDNNVYFVSGTDYSTMRIEKTGGNIRGSPAIYDIDQDGFEDVGIGSDDNNLYVFNGVKIHLCSTELGIYFDNQPAFYKNKIVVSSNLKSYVISATDCSQISSIFTIAPSPGASFGVYMENNSPRLVVGTGNKVFVFNESFSQIYPFPFTYSGGSIASSPVLGDIDGDGSLEFSIAIAFSTGATGTIFTYRITRDVDFSLEWREFAHDRYNSSFSEQKENSYFSPRYTSKPSDTENIYLTQEHKEKSAVGCSSFRETALLFLFFTLFIVRRKILFSRNQNLKRRKIYGEMEKN